MFVITADQIDSRNDYDRARSMIAHLVSHRPQAFSLPPDQTAGDEIQLLSADADATLTAILALHRSGHWSVGLGVGAVRMPLPAATRHATGGAFIAAREAVVRAKKTEAHFALDCDHSEESAPGIEAVLTMLLLLRQRRTPQGWEAGDLLESGLAQTDIAIRLGISTGAVSQRIKTAQLRLDQAARPAVIRLLEQLDLASPSAHEFETDGPE